MSLRILLVDDSETTRRILRVLLGSREWAICGEAENGCSGIELFDQLRPDLVVLDLAMPDMNGISAAKHFKQVLPKAKLVFLTMNRDLDIASEAFRLGAVGYVLKTAAASDLIHCIREILRGGYYASPVLTEGIVGSFVRAFKTMKSSHNLTVRQRDVLQLLAEGMSMKQVANRLNITPRTVAFHKYTMMEQLNIKSNDELMAFAASHLPSPS